MFLKPLFYLGVLSLFSSNRVHAVTFPDLYEATITDLQAGLAAGNFTSVDLVNAYVARINQVNDKLHAVIETSPTALAQAAALDAQRAQGTTLGPLHGIPFLVKDNIATRVEDGMNTTAGSYALLNSVVPGDATVIVMLRKAGGIILGKTGMSEWAAFGSIAPNGWSGRGGQATSAYYPNGDACGSSTGSGISASIGLAAATLGTETSGSISCPASRNNVVGVKATLGLTSRSGVIPVSVHQDTVGPLARTVTDAAIVLSAIAGKDSADNYTSAQPNTVPDYLSILSKDAFKGARIGVPRTVFLDTKFGPIPGLTAFTAALKIMEGLGANITDPANLPSATEIVANNLDAGNIVLSTDFKFGIQAYLANLTSIPTNVHNIADIAAFNDAHKDLEEPILDAYTEWNLHFDLAESMQENGTYTAAIATNHDIGATRGIDAVLKQFNLDALVMPENSLMEQLAGYVGYPIVTVPLGFTPNDTAPGTTEQPIYPYPGMPFGLSFVGTAFSETKLLAFAYAYEQATQTRLQQRAYEDATPTTQLADVVGKNVSSGSTATTSSTPGGSGTGTGAARSVGVGRGAWCFSAIPIALLSWISYY